MTHRPPPPSSAPPPAEAWQDLAFTLDVMAAVADAAVMADEARSPWAGFKAALLGTGNTAVRIARQTMMPTLSGWTDLEGLRNSLVQSGQAVRLPPVATAATAPDIQERYFPGGSIALRPARSRPNQIYLVVTHGDGRSEPQAVAVTAADQNVAVVLPIGAMGVEGVTQVILDATAERDAELIRLLQDPQSEVVIVWRN